MLRKAGPEAGDDKTFVITKRELRGSHKGNERIQPVMDELLRVIIRIRTTSTKGKPAIMSQSLLASCVEEIAEDGLSVVEFQFRSEEPTSELQSLMRISYAVFCLKKKKIQLITRSNKNQSRKKKS